MYSAPNLPAPSTSLRVNEIRALAPVSGSLMSATRENSGRSSSPCSGSEIVIVTPLQDCVRGVRM